MTVYQLATLQYTAPQQTSKAAHPATASAPDQLWVHSSQLSRTVHNIVICRSILPRSSKQFKIHLKSLLDGFETVSRYWRESTDKYSLIYTPISQPTNLRIKIWQKDVITSEPPYAPNNGQHVMTPRGAMEPPDWLNSEKLRRLCMCTSSLFFPIDNLKEER